MKGYPMTETITKMINFGITGNVIPMQWFDRIKLGDKPDTIAIILLSDIVYWYRPIEVRDETTGKIIEYRKKFKADKLQRSYQAFSNIFGFTKRQVRDAIHRLNDLGIINLDFRTINTDSGMVLGNVLFIGLNVEKLGEITNPLPYYAETSEVSPQNVIGTTPERQTNTETTTETTTKPYAPKNDACADQPLAGKQPNNIVRDIGEEEPSSTLLGKNGRKPTREKKERVFPDVGLETIRAQLRPLGFAFLKAMGDSPTVGEMYAPREKTVSLWYKELWEWDAMGAGPKDVTETIAEMKKRGLVIGGIQSVANMLRNHMAEKATHHAAVFKASDVGELEKE